MATTNDSDPMSKREAQYRRGHPKTPIHLWWAWDDDGNDVPRINIANPDENDVSEPVYDAYDVGSFDELAEEVFGTTEKMPMGQTEQQIGVMVGRGDDVAFYTDRELLGFVDELSDELADGLIDWFGDIPSLCEEIRRGSWPNFAHDAQVEGREWADEPWEIDNIERAMKDAKVWQEPDGVTADDW